MSTEINRVLIVGAGTMGHSLSLLFAKEGYPVRLVDKDQAALERALNLIDAAGGTLVETGLAERRAVDEVPRLIDAATDLEAAAQGVDLAIETVDENPAVKREIFSVLDRCCPEHALLCSNTSALNVFEFVETRRPEKVMIVHFFAPPHLIPLVEVVPGPLTDKASVGKLVGVLERLGKEPLVLREYIPGFVVNRIQRAIAREAFSLVDRGVATIEEVDRAVRASLGVRLPVVGVLQTYDFTGLDVYHSICKETPIAPPTPSSPPEIVKEKVEKGLFGVKTGKGLYDYGGRKPEEVLGKRDRRYIEVLKALNKDKTPL